MKVLHFKNILNLLKHTIPFLNIYCKSSECVVINITNPACGNETSELLYHFEFVSLNKLLEEKIYLLDIADVIRNFKHIKGKDVICFEDTTTHFLINIKGVGDLTTTIKHPLIYEDEKKPYFYKSYKNFVNFINSPSISMLLTDFSRILKSLKNTSDTYEIVIDDNTFNISNTNPVPMSFIIPLPPALVIDNRPLITSTLTNNCILRLNKLQSDNTLINIGRDFISGCVEGELKFYIYFLNVE